MNHPSCKITRDGDVLYVTFENGRTYKLEHVLNHRDRFRRLLDNRAERTRRRVWWRRNVVSRDEPNTKAARADYDDHGSWERKLVRWLDHEFTKPTIEPIAFGVLINGKLFFKCAIAKRNCIRIANRMHLVHWKSAGQFVASVAKYGSKGREKTMMDFGICEATYYWRVFRYAEILGFQDGVDMCL